MEKERKAAEKLRLRGVPAEAVTDTNTNTLLLGNIQSTSSNATPTTITPPPPTVTSPPPPPPSPPAPAAVEPDAEAQAEETPFNLHPDDPENFLKLSAALTLLGKHTIWENEIVEADSLLRDYCTELITVKLPNFLS